MKAAVIGLGRMGQAHIKAYTEVGMPIMCVCDLAYTAKPVPVGFEVGYVTSDWRQAVAEPEVTHVSVCTWDDTHAEIAGEALLAGKNVIVEKPLCQTYDQLQGVYQAYSANVIYDKKGYFPRVHLTMNLPLRETGDHLAPDCRVYIEADYLHNLGDRLSPGSWRSQMAFYSPVQGGGIHLLDYCMHVLGLRPISVQGMRCGDWITVNILQCQCGSVIKTTTDLTYSGSRKHRIACNGVESLSWRQHDPGYCVRRFAQGEPVVSARECFDLMAVVLACDEAIATGQTVDVRYLP